MSTQKVGLPAESWNTVQAILMREALRLGELGEEEEAASLMDLVIPKIEEATDDRKLVECRSLVRQALGMPALDAAG